MQAVVLVGGQGTRLRPVTYDIPKALVPLRNRPFMGYMLDFLRNGGLNGAVLSLGYLPDPIQAYLCGQQDLEGFSVDYAVEDRALGTAGGIKNAQEYLDGDTFVVVNGDVLCGMDLASKRNGAVRFSVYVLAVLTTLFGLLIIPLSALVGASGLL